MSCCAYTFDPNSGGVAIGDARGEALASRMEAWWAEAVGARPAEWRVAVEGVVCLVSWREDGAERVCRLRHFGDDRWVAVVRAPKGAGWLRVSCDGAVGVLGTLEESFAAAVDWFAGV